MVSLRGTQRWLTVALVVGLLANVGVLGLAAAGDQSQDDSDVERIGHQDITITDVDATVGGAQIGGEGLPEVHIQERTYTIQDATLATDGITLTHNGQTYEICSVDITVDDVSVTLQDVHVGGQ